MNRAHVIRFVPAVALEISFFAALNFFDDWTLQVTPIRFVAASSSGAAYLVAVSNF